MPTQIQKQIEEAVERATKNIFIELFADLSEEIIKIDDKGAYTKTKNVIRKELSTIATKSVEAEQERIYKALVREEGFSGEIDCPIDPYEKTSLLEIKKAIYETSK